MKNGQKPSRLTVRDALPAAVGVALLPPLWAVVSALAGIPFGWVSLASAGMLLPFHEPLRAGVRQSLSFFMGCIWGLTATIAMSALPLPQMSALFLVLCVWGFAAVLLSEVAFRQKTVLAIWLGSWAIALGTFGEITPANYAAVFGKLLLAMLCGVWYIGLLNQKFQALLDRHLRCEKASHTHEKQA